MLMMMMIMMVDFIIIIIIMMMMTVQEDDLKESKLCQVCWDSWGEKPAAGEEDDQGFDKEDVPH